MAVYVDPLFDHGGSSAFRWTRSCHMYADAPEELHAMADAVGMRRAWFQDRGTLPHYDLVPKRRAHAVRLGAVERTRREMVDFMRAQRRLRMDKTMAEQGVERAIGEAEAKAEKEFMDGLGACALAQQEQETSEHGDRCGVTNEGATERCVLYAGHAVKRHRFGPLEPWPPPYFAAFEEQDTGEEVGGEPCARCGARVLECACAEGWAEESEEAR